MPRVNTITISPPLINSSCAWASDEKQLRELYHSPFTGAVTTRTATPDGFEEDASHTVAFSSSGVCSVNSYGYSPLPLDFYLDTIERIILSDLTSTKPFIVSITSSSPSSIQKMVSQIQAFRQKHNDPFSPSSRVAIELNTSCPNIKNSPPAAYNIATLLPILEVLSNAFAQDPTLTIGLKLAPFVMQSQFHEVITAISPYSHDIVTVDGTRRKNSFSFLTCTNTLGNSLIFSTDDSKQFALPTVLGGLAGEPLHPLALGNVYTFSTLLRASEDPCLRDIVIIGVGGVTTPDAVQRMNRAGAQVVGCATLLGKVGIKAFEILSGQAP